MVNEENRLIDYDVYGSDGNKIGSVENYWVDEETRRPEFIGVKTGWLFGETHVIPVGAARIDTDDNRIEVPYEEDFVKEAPSFAPEQNLSEEDEARVREYFGAAPGLATEEIGERGGVIERDMEERELPRGELEEREAVEMPVAEEELEVGKREVPEGAVRLRKVVRTEHEEVPVELEREEVHVERLSPEEAANLDETELGEDEAVIRTNREEPVVQKETEIKGGVRAYKTEERERRTVEGDVRKEEVDVDRDTDLDADVERKNRLDRD